MWQIDIRHANGGDGKLLRDRPAFVGMNSEIAAFRRLHRTFDWLPDYRRNVANATNSAFGGPIWHRVAFNCRNFPQSSSSSTVVGGTKSCRRKVESRERDRVEDGQSSFGRWGASLVSSFCSTVTKLKSLSRNNFARSPINPERVLVENNPAPSFVAWDAPASCLAAALENAGNCWIGGHPLHEAVPSNPPDSLTALQISIFPPAERDLYRRVARALGPTLSSKLVSPGFIRVVHLSGKTATASRDDSCWTWLCSQADRAIWRVAAGESSPDDGWRGTFPNLGEEMQEQTTDWLVPLIENATATSAFSSPDGHAVRAGLLLWQGRLDDSHRVSQSIENQGRHRAGDYWHAIMHRREGDFGNSKYWFRHVGPHPIYDELARRVRGFMDEFPNSAAIPALSRCVQGTRWNPAAFVDACETATRDDQPEVRAILERVQGIEMLLLLISTAADAGVASNR